jgi:hypothetical protein
MAFTYDLTTSTGKIRLICMDNQPDNYIFEDDELSAFYELERSSLRRACALILETIASNEAYVLKRITALDLQTDGPAVAAELRQRAKLLREQALEDEAKEDDGSFDVAEQVLTNFQRRDRIINQYLRGAI